MAIIIDVHLRIGNLTLYFSFLLLMRDWCMTPFLLWLMRHAHGYCTWSLLRNILYKLEKKLLANRVKQLSIKVLHQASRNAGISKPRNKVENFFYLDYSLLKCRYNLHYFNVCWSSVGAQD